MRAANITPLPSATWDNARWDNARAVISRKIVAGEADPHAIDNDPQSFISRVEGTSIDFQCMVPIYNSAMNDNRLEDLYISGVAAMSTANITPLPLAEWDKARWDNAKAVISEKMVAGEPDSFAIDNDLQSFISKVEGIARGFQCNVPIYDLQGKLMYCGHQVQRRDRILRHVKETHLSYRPFVCEGRCGTIDWYSVSGKVWC